MTRNIQEELHGFAVALLERSGALVDWPTPAEEGVTVLTPELAAALHAPAETMRLSSQASGGGELQVSLASDFLDSAQHLLQAEPRIGTFRLPQRYLKRGAMDEVVRRVFAWPNAKVEIRDVRATHAEYHTWWFRAALVSEDRWEASFSVTFNSDSGTQVEIPDPLGLWELEPHPTAARLDPRSTYPRAVAVARSRLPSLAGEFLGRMDAHLLRDRQRLREYYHALLREAENRRQRGHAQPDPEELQAKKRAVDMELRRKLAELDQRYAAEAVLEPVVLLRTEIPVLAVDLLVFRKQARKVHTLFWNALRKELEPLCCSRCGAGSYCVAFTNETVDPLCPACGK
jgi:hypothetical protein